MKARASCLILSYVRVAKNFNRFTTKSTVWVFEHGSKVHSVVETVNILHWKNHPVSRKPKR